MLACPPFGFDLILPLRFSLPVQSYLVAPGYDPNSLQNDIAMLRLQSPSKLTPATLASTFPEDGTSLTVVGWGLTEDPAETTELQ